MSLNRNNVIHSFIHNTRSRPYPSYVNGVTPAIHIDVWYFSLVDGAIFHALFTASFFLCVMSYLFVESRFILWQQEETQWPAPPLPSHSVFSSFFLHVFTLIGSSWTVSRKSRSAECINESDHPGKLFSLHFLSGQCEDTRVYHALKTMNEHSQEQCSPAATFPAG